MKIDLEFPFSDDWRSGYIRESKVDKRKRVDLFNSNKDRTTISYARYLMSVKIGRYLTEDEEVDHVDSDKTNDDINNLQILSQEEHRVKSAAEGVQRKVYEMVCPYCSATFIRYRIDKRYKRSFCSASCIALFRYHG